MLLKLKIIQTKRYVGDVSAVRNPMHGASANVHGASRYTLTVNLGEVVACSGFCAVVLTSHIRLALSLHEIVRLNLSEVDVTGAPYTPCTFAYAPCMGLRTAGTSPTCLYR